MAVIEALLKAGGEVATKTVETAESMKDKLVQLDKPINVSEGLDKTGTVGKEVTGKDKLKDLDKPLNSDATNQKETTSKDADGLVKGDADEVKRMDQITIYFNCPDGMDCKEFKRQLQNQQDGLNKQPVADNIRNREAYQARKEETGNGRDAEGAKAQREAREKAMQQAIEKNQLNGMSYTEAKEAAEKELSTKAALHNPDQIAGGDPTEVTEMGDASVNSSIGAQWMNGRAEQLADAVKQYAQGKSMEELENTLMNVNLVML